MSTKNLIPGVVAMEVAEVFFTTDCKMMQNDRSLASVNAKRVAITILFKNGYNANKLALYFNISRTHVYACVKRQTDLNDIYPAENKLYQECKRRCEDAK